MLASQCLAASTDLWTSAMEMVHSAVNKTGWVWLVVGFTGQFIFFMRFFWQWVASERAGRSHVPVVFWYFSLAGSSILLVYAVFKDNGVDPVFALAQPLQIVIYVRNLMLIRKQKLLAGNSPTHCVSCSEKLADGARYCHHCGEEVVVAS